MRKFFAFLVLMVAGFWLADYLGVYKFPLTGEQVSQTAQRAFGRGRRQPQKAEVIPVLVAVVRRADVPITFDAVGTVQSLNMVSVRAQADGKLLELKFKDGDEVRKGDVLAKIDPTTYKAAFDQAVAKKAQDEAMLANARIDLERYSKLAAGNFGSRQQADTQKALVAQLEAQGRVDQALIDSARAVLDYTNVVAPISGRTGLRTVDPGNIVHASDAAGIVTITQLQPVGALLSLPQQQLRAVNAGQSKAPLKVLALEADNTTVADTGRVETIDNQVDPTTGTVRIRTEFPNANKALWPGQFINLRLFIDVLQQVVVVPGEAVQRGPTGSFAYVINAENKAVMTPIVVQRQNELIAVISSGLAPPARVVTTGFAQLTDGAEVRVMEATPVSAPPVAAAGGEASPAQGPGRDPGGPGQRQNAGDGGARRQGGGSAGERRGGGANAGPGGRAGAANATAATPGSAPAAPAATATAPAATATTQ